MSDKVKQLLDAYKERLATRLSTAIEQSWQQFLPSFETHLMETVRTKLSTTTAATVEEQTLLYPEGTKYFYRVGACCYLVVEQKPQVRTMNFLISGDKRVECANKERYRLAFPYVIFVIGLGLDPERDSLMETAWQLRIAHVGYSNRPVWSLKDMVYTPNLPNVNHHVVCVGTGYPQHAASIAACVERLISHFWQGVFSRDWCDDFNAMKKIDPLFASLESWEENSIKNPLFPVKVMWPGGIKIEQLLTAAGLKTKSDPIYTLDSYSRPVVAEAAKRARLDVANAFEGVDVESLDNQFCDDLNKYLAQEGEKP